MQIIADLQLHSRFSRAVSKAMTIPYIAEWSRRKGIGLVATGDWTHPMWMREIERYLEEVGNGLLRLKSDAEVGAPLVSPRPFDFAQGKQKASTLSSREGLETARLPASVTDTPLFLLATEISCIYSQGGKVRRIHTLIWVPSIDAARKIGQEMTRRGCNLLSDGRPIVGLTSIQLAQLVLSVEPYALIIPAHAWTPWFSIYGALGGFDSIEEAFGSFTKHIYAVETGLSSNPAMNWRVKELDGRSILSFSDAHSGPKLGREATVFEVPDGKLSYKAIYSAIRMADTSVGSLFDSHRQGPDRKPAHHEHTAQAMTMLEKVRHPVSADAQAKIAYTIEFHPEEGKYHYTGHRACSGWRILPVGPMLICAVWQWTLKVLQCRGSEVRPFLVGRRLLWWFLSRRLLLKQLGLRYKVLKYKPFIFD
jgi:PHP family Zn ribbon phosphoesterase